MADSPHAPAAIRSDHATHNDSGDEHPSAQILGVDLSPTQPKMCDSPLNLPRYEKKIDMFSGSHRTFSLSGRHGRGMNGLPRPHLILSTSVSWPAPSWTGQSSLVNATREYLTVRFGSRLFVSSHEIFQIDTPSPAAGLNLKTGIFTLSHPMIDFHKKASSTSITSCLWV
jgi:hypothetical protein